MKHLLIAAAFGLAALSTTAQKNAIESYYSDYEAKEEFTKVNVTSKMFELAVHVEGSTQEEQELLDAVSKIEGLTVLVQEETENALELYASALSRPGKEFEELMTVEDEDSEVTFMIKERKGVISELLLIFGTPTEFGVANLWGEIDLKQLRKMTETFQVYGMKHFNEELAEAGMAVKVYPNPAPKGSNVTLELSEALEGGTLSLFDLNGKEVTNTNITSTRVDLPLTGVEAGTYVVKIMVDNTKVYSEKIIVQ